MYGAVVSIHACKSPLLVLGTCPYMSDNNPRGSALGANGVPEMIPPIGTVGKHIARVVGKSPRTRFTVIHVRRRDRNLFH